MKQITPYIVMALVAALVIILWSLIVSSFPTSEYFIGSPSSVFAYFRDNLVRLLIDLGQTGLEAVAGLVIATAFSLLILVVVFVFAPVKKLVRDTIVAFQVIPIIVFIPFIALVVGIGFPAKVILSAMVAAFPILAVCLDGYDLLPSYVFEIVDVYNVRKSKAIRLLLIPVLLPHIFAGVRLGATMAVLGAIIAEFSGARYGLGRNIFQTSNQVEPELLICSIILCIGLSLGLYKLVARLGQLCMPWLSK